MNGYCINWNVGVGYPCLQISYLEEPWQLLKAVESCAFRASDRARLDPEHLVLLLVHEGS